VGALFGGSLVISFIKSKKVHLILVMALIVCVMPVRVKRRLVCLTKTAIVLPSSETTLVSERTYRKYKKLIHQASEEFNVPVPLIAAVIRAESGFNPYAVSRTGAMGLMQLMPGTWSEMGGIGSPFNAGMNIKLGTKYLRTLMNQFRGNLRLTIAAYNAGPGAVRRFRRIPPYRETRRYVPKVLRYYRKYRRIIKVS